MHELQSLLLQKLPPQKWYIDVTGMAREFPITHAQILEALGEDWAMTGDYKLWKVDMWYRWMAETRFYNLTCELPSNISDLSLPEYEETRKQLIQLLTK